MEQFSCCLIGDDKMLTDACHILNDLGHIIKYVYTENQEIQQWCEHQNISYVNYDKAAHFSPFEKINLIIVIGPIENLAVNGLLAGREYLYYKNPITKTLLDAQYNKLSEGRYQHVIWSKFTSQKKCIPLVSTKIPINQDSLKTLQEDCYHSALELFQDLVVSLSRDKTHLVGGYGEYLFTRKLETNLLPAIHGFCKIQNSTVLSVIIAIIHILISRYNACKLSALSIKAQDIITFDHFLPNIYQAAWVHSQDIENFTFLSLVDCVQKNLENTFSQVTSINIYAYLKYKEGKGSILCADTLDNTLCQGVLQSNIALFIAWDGDKICVTLEADANLAEVYVLDYFLKNMVSLCERVIAQPAAKLEDVPLLAHDEEKLILHTFAKQENQFNLTDTTLTFAFEEIVKTHASAVALVAGEEGLTYEELNKKANQLAHYIIEVYSTHYQQALLPETPIGIYLGRGINLIVAILAVLKTGAAYVPLDPILPATRLNYIIKNSATHVVLTDALNLKRAEEELSPDVIFLNMNDNVISQYATTSPPCEIAPQNLAYIIYTSGSTGEPKGVLVAHAGVCNMVLWTIYYYPITSKDCIIQIASFAFDFSVWEIFSALLAGAKLVLTREELYKDPDYLCEEIIRNQVSVIGGVPSLFKMLLTSAKIQNVNTLKQIVCGAEPLTKALSQQILSHFDAKLYHGYGPTEATITSTHWLCTKSNYKKGIPLGRPIARTYLYVLDDALNLVPCGTVGELYIGGVGVAKGYVKRADLTQAQFLKNPFKNSDAPILYKTGDLIRLRSQGNFEFVGRKDYQIKLRGFRIELEEIENTLKTFAPIADCIATLFSDNDSEHIVCYYILKNSHHTAKNAIKAFLANLLPSYMLPSYYIELESFPLTASGKINRTALPSPQYDLSLSQPTIPFGNKKELEVAKVFAEVLNLPLVSLHHDFFEMGGNSLTATQVVARINQLMQVRCRVTDLFNYPTVKTFTRYLTDLTVDVSHDICLTRVSAQNSYPLSFAQQRIWFMFQFEDQKSATYNIPLAFEILGDLNINALENTFNQVITRHESLRTIFKSENGIPNQIILPSYFIKLTPHPIAKCNLSAEISKAAHFIFDFNNPPWCVLLFRLTPSHHYLLINQHNIITDAWSSGILLNELNTVYKAMVMNTLPALSPLDYQYKDYAVWQRNYLAGDLLIKQLNFWKKYLQAFTETNLITDKVRPKVQTYKGDHVGLAVDANIADKLEHMAHHNQATLFMVLLAAFNILLYRYSGNEDIVIGTGLAGRTQKALENIMGFFVNTLAIRNQVSPTITFLQFLMQVKESCLKVYANQDIPFELIVEKLRIPREADRTPIFQIMFLLQNTNENINLALQNMEISKYPLKQKTAMFDITFNITKHHNGLTFDIQYNSDLFAEQRIRKFAAHFKMLLHSIILHPSAEIQNLEMLTQRDVQNILVDWNNNHKSYPKEKSVVDLFNEQVFKLGELPALVTPTSTLSYQALQVKVNFLLPRIQNCLPPSLESIVGICLPRGPELVVSVLSVLKGGAAYILLDPCYPLNRLQFMLQDAKVKLLITDKKIGQEFAPSLSDAVTILYVDKNGENSASQKSFGSLPQALAYVVYTSGSTGHPKGIMVEHASLLNILYDIKEKLNFSKRDKLLSLTAVSFDIFGLELFLPLISGAQLILYPTPTMRDPECIIDLIFKHQPTLIQGTPSTWRMLIELLEKHNIAKQFSILVGGEALDRKLAKRLQRIAIRLWNVYGPAETTIWSTYDEVNEDEIFIGRGFANTYCYVLDKNRKLLPPGIPGELYIGGEGVARGYVNNDTLTLQKFMVNPFTSYLPKGQSCTRLYKTGDIVYFTLDGKLKYLYRNDHQIKVRGHRVEPQEIQCILNTYPEIAHCEILVKERDDIENTLIAYYVLKIPHKIVTISALRDYLATYLPVFMIPNEFIELDAFPLNANNKIDTFKLLQIENVKTASIAPSDEPKTIIEKMMRQVWQKFLPKKDMSINASFFELGGHSLLIPQLIVELNEVFHVPLTIREFIEHITIKKLAHYLEDKTRQGMKKPCPV